MNQWKGIRFETDYLQLFYRIIDFDNSMQEYQVRSLLITNLFLNQIWSKYGFSSINAMVSRSILTNNITFFLIKLNQSWDFDQSMVSGSILTKNNLFLLPVGHLWSGFDHPHRPLLHSQTILVVFVFHVKPKNCFEHITFPQEVPWG